MSFPTSSESEISVSLGDRDLLLFSCEANSRFDPRWCPLHKVRPLNNDRPLNNVRLLLCVTTGGGVELIISCNVSVYMCRQIKALEYVDKAAYTICMLHQNAKQYFLGDSLPPSV